MAAEQGRFAEDYLLECGDGQVIFSEGDDSREMYVVSSGEVQLSRKGPTGEVVLATIRRGEFFGEMALLESLPRSATARARGLARLVVVSPGGFLLKIRRDPTFAFEMLQVLSGRLRVTNDKLMESLQTSGQADVHALLSAVEFGKQSTGT